MNYATRLIQFPLGLVGMAISLAVLPSLSKHASALTAARHGGEAGDDDLVAYRQTLTFGVRMVLLLMVPATVGLMLLREPFVQLLFERGRFGAEETARTALVFLAYAPQLPFTALDQLLIVAFYARKDTRTPVLVGVAGVGLYLASALALIAPLDVAGLALANAIQNSAHGLVLLALLERAGLGVLGRPLVAFGLKVVFASLGMGAALWLFDDFLLSRASGELAVLAALGAAVSLAGAVYVALLELLGLRDARFVWELVWERFNRQPRA
jgi:putative peptidoglycan lipid II flippase